MRACRELRDAGFPAFVLYAGEDGQWHMAALALPSATMAKALRLMAEAVEEQLPAGTMN